ncbi:uncharacterized protein LOC111039597 [Myzus persicae]|uniref:uncharacterized protein LOC111039597 n=1 Tax=Myzus persicae TaxID=13164 RepID=UPI000B932AED|nr:uncharacterized protein LOC111039597 [Myzus persicae]
MNSGNKPVNSSSSDRVLRTRTTTTQPTSSKVLSPVASSSTIDDVMSTLLSFRNDLTTSNEKLSAAQASQFRDLKNDLKNLSCLIADLKAENTALRNDVDSLMDKVANLESGSTPNIASTTVSQVLQETFERERCSYNALVYGVPESISSTITERVKDDKETFQKLLEENSIEPSHGSKYIRLGKARADYVRPLKVIYTSKEDASKLIASFADLRNQGVSITQGFRIVKDKTKLQREQLRSCHSEFDHRTRNGESGLSIKYINGSPIVISEGSKNGVHHRRLADPITNTKIN